MALGGPGGDFGEIAAFANEVREAVESVFDHAELHDERERVLGLARSLADNAVCEVSYGVFAESSAGKSLLLGALLGNPLLLPVDSRTVTCNITELRLRPAAVRVATIVGARVEYLSDDEVHDYVRHLAHKVGGLVRGAGGDLSTVQDITYNWSGLHRLRQVLDTPESLRLPPNGLVDLRTEVDEMLRAEESLRARGVNPGATEDLVTPDGFFDAAAMSALIDHGEPGNGGTQRAGEQALVRKVVAEVEIPVDVWEAAKLFGAAVKLVDIPGSLSSRRPIRDEYLRVRELDTVDTALFFLDSRPGSTHESRALQDLMSSGKRDGDLLRDAVLVVAAKFDLIPEVPGLLLDEPPVDAEETAVLSRSVVLQQLVTASRNLLPPGHDERIFFVSPYVTMALADELDLGWDADQVVAHLRASQEVTSARDKALRWREVGHVPGRLGEGLTAFTVDGGLRRLRDGMTSHAAHHGVAQALDRLRRQADELGTAFQRLERHRVDLGPVPTGDDDVRLLFERVLGELADRVTEARKALPRRLADPEALPSIGASPGERVRQLAERTVYDWPEWKQLFENLTDGMVRVTASKPLGDMWADLFDDAAAPVLVKDFEGRYREACAEVATSLTRLVEDRVETYLDESALITSGQHDLIGSVLTESVFRRLGHDLGGRRLAVAVNALSHLEVLVGNVRKTLSTTTSEVDDRYFPLDPTRALPWHQDSPRRGSESYTGIGQVLRLRQTMVDAVIAACRSTLAAVLSTAADQLERDLRGLERTFGTINQDSVHWIALVTEARRADGTEEIVR
ncbi:hypothetical protein [Umezawaea tangerina]|uniref:Dynamin family protein n=1 Tax=Umezawaea tangerina TaxID=84725 RepID=A0A2T0T6R4_9PSEU|nr:hypothetical protein [Umezawaea tangerina]PRY41333.1 hypothetical protein CLV43_10591 [Umezawaea tangerina]